MHTVQVPEAGCLEGLYGHRFENDDVLGRNTVAALFGFSFFTR